VIETLDANAQDALRAKLLLAVVPDTSRGEFVTGRYRGFGQKMARWAQYIADGEILREALEKIATKSEDLFTKRDDLDEAQYPASLVSDAIRELRQEIDQLGPPFREALGGISGPLAQLTQPAQP
jgi:hypothetical protein